MATERQIEANRKNAEKCTGPRTPQGKAISSQNALKTGLDAKSEVIRHENRSDYEDLIAEYYARFNPATPEERCLVDTLIKCEWLGRRFMTVDARIWEHGLTGNKSDNLGFVFVRYSETFGRLDRRVASTQRNFQQALKQLRQIQADRPTEPVEPAEPAVADVGNAADAATEELAPKLVSFPNPAKLPPLTPVSPAPTPLQPGEHDPQNEENPPIAA